MVEKSLLKDLQALSLKEDADKQNLIDAQVKKPEVLEDSNKVEERECKTLVPKYEMTKQELWLQEEKEKNYIYTSTFSHEGDASDLNSEMDMESESHAYPFLD